MGAFARQIETIITLSLAQSRQRLWSTLTIVVSMALVVATLMTFLAMGSGFARTLNATGSDNVAFILSKSAGTDLNSSIPNETVRLLQNAPGIANDANGGSTLSPEVFVVASARRSVNKADMNITFRGLTRSGFDLRPGFSLTGGRMFNPGTNEIIIGLSAADEYDNFDIGDEPRIGGSDWKVVGHFSQGGTIFESEIWADLGTTQAIFDRAGAVQVVRAKLSSAPGLEQLRNFVEDDPRLQIDISTEREHYAAQSTGLQMLVFFGWVVAVTMSLGAVAGSVNMMYASVDARTKSIATLRAIGFGGMPAFIGTMVEVLLLASLGGIVGVGFAVLVFSDMSFSSQSSNFTQVAFKAAIGAQDIQLGVTLSLILGLIGGIGPAFRAATVPILKLG